MNRKLIKFILDWLQAKSIENYNNHSYGYVIFLTDLKTLTKDLRKFEASMVKNGEKR